MAEAMKTPDMSNEEIIDVLKGLVFGSFDRTTPKEREALDLAIKALEKPQVTVFAENANEEEIEDFKQELENVLERSQEGEWIDYDNTFYKCPECGYLLEKCCPQCQNKVILPKGGAE